MLRIEVEAKLSMEKIEKQKNRKTGKNKKQQAAAQALGQGEKTSEKMRFFLSFPLDRNGKLWYNNEGESLRRYRDIGKIGFIFKNRNGYGVARIGFLRNGLADGRTFFV